MIRKFKNQDLDRIMEIWLESNIEAHDFIPKEYWISNYDMVKDILPKAEVYVFEEDANIKAFVGIDDGYIAGIFVAGEFRSKGIGKKLLQKCKTDYDKLTLSVYKRNKKAIDFYLREGFSIESKQPDPNTNEIEYKMVYNKY